ncbi:MAG: glycosyltransferase [Acidimicrobiales bacterium]|nr:glycosyltransferase [Acidimicrobiales bacterium]
MSEYPRVVLVSQSGTGTGTATGASMRKLFDGWPGDRLLEITADANATMRTIGAEHISSPDGLLSTEIADQAKAFQPDLMYARAAEWPEPWWSLGHDLASALKIPYVAHEFDDVVGWQIGRWKGPTGVLRAVRRDVSLRKMLTGAVDVFACSSRHAEYLNVLYGVNAVTFVNWLDTRTPVTATGSPEVFRLRFSGRCNVLQHAGALRLVAEAARELGEEGRSVLIDCVGPNRTDFDRFFEDFPHLRDIVRDCGNVDDRDKQFEFLEQGDAILVTMNFDDDSLRFVRYATSSKALDVISTDVPALVVGSPKMETVDWARRSGWADVVDTPAVERVKATIMELMERSVLPESQRIARRKERKNWSREVVTESFAERLREAAVQPEPN